jgi:hypothetical protein
VVFVPTASAAASTATGSNPGVRTDETHRAPAAVVHASAGRSVPESASCRTRNGTEQSATTAAAASAGSTRNRRRPDHAEVESNRNAAGLHSTIGTKLRPMPASQASTISFVSG